MKILFPFIRVFSKMSVWLFRVLVEMLKVTHYRPHASVLTRNYSTWMQLKWKYTSDCQATSMKCSAWNCEQSSSLVITERNYQGCSLLLSHGRATARKESGGESKPNSNLLGQRRIVASNVINERHVVSRQVKLIDSGGRVLVAFYLGPPAFKCSTVAAAAFLLRVSLPLFSSVSFE